MPYRRLPNTDSARIRAMKAALDKGKALHPFKLAYSQNKYVKLKTFLPKFEKAVKEQRLAIRNQAKNKKDYIRLMRKTQMYISHFVQVLNFSILREELPSKVRALYKLKIDSKKIPALNSEEEIIIAGERIINGEEIRTRQGGTPLLNPKISIVKMHYEKFKDACYYQGRLKISTLRAQTKVASLRAQADNIILEIWNDVEEKCEVNSPNEKRQYCSEYGLVYVYRKTEVPKTNSFFQLRA